MGAFERGVGRRGVARRPLATAVIIAVAFAVFVPAPAIAHNDWNGYHWSSATSPVEVTFVDSLSARFGDEGVLPEVMSDWDTRVVALAVTPAAHDRRLRRECPAVSGAIRICDADYGDRWFGHTDVILDGDRIVGGSIRINNHFGTGSRYRRFVLCHEMGHALGLGHRANGPSCLNGGQHPDAHDRDMLREIYEDPDPPPSPDDEPECALLTCPLPTATALARVRRAQDL